MPTSICKGVRTSTPNRCKKVRGCKVATGTKRTYCRKAHNKNNRNKTVKKRKTAKRVNGLTRKAILELRRLK